MRDTIKHVDDIRSGVGLISFLSECPDCGELVHNEKSMAVTLSVILKHLEVTADQESYVQLHEKITAKITACASICCHFECECGASWQIDQSADDVNFEVPMEPQAVY